MKLGAHAWIAFAASAARFASAQFPVNKVYGVNLGSWFVIEPYMMPSEWVNMGGSQYPACDCGKAGCTSSEWDLVNKIGQSTANKVFASHWDSWITQADVRAIAAAGLNTVRIPIGFWIVESAKLAATDKYPEGGMGYLTRGLGWLADANINVLLDMHAVPDQATGNNPFAGRCNPNPTFFQNTNSNFGRMASVFQNLTTMAHNVHEWRTVFGIELLNEPPQNVAQSPGTPNYAQYMDIGNAAIRNTESSLGASKPLTIVAMDYNWQYGGAHANPADSARGVAAYDNHLYLSFGGVADPNKNAYLTAVCHAGPDRVTADSTPRNTPLVFGEWWLATQSAVNPDAAFYRDFSDAQRVAYEAGSGWMYWSWKFSPADASRAYRDGITAGYFSSSDASHKFNPSICNGR